MTIQTAASPSEPVETDEDSSRRVRRILLLLLVIIVSVAAALAYRASHADHPPTYSSEQLQAMAAMTLPSQFDRVDSTWGCVSNDQSACFTSSLTGLDSVEALVSAMGAEEYSTMPGNGFPAHYYFCTTVASAPASVLVSALPTNTVEQGGTWVVPPGQDPKFDGSAVDIHLTGPGTCP